jgi:hypothetical protein
MRPRTLRQTFTPHDYSLAIESETVLRRIAASDLARLFSTESDPAKPSRSTSVRAPGIRFGQKPFASRVYEYYDPAVSAKARPVTFEVLAH